MQLKMLSARYDFLELVTGNACTYKNIIGIYYM